MMLGSKSLNRIELPYANDSKQWRFTSEDIDKFQKRQYIFLYRIRIDLLRGRILSTADHTGMAILLKSYLLFREGNKK